MCGISGLVCKTEAALNDAPDLLNQMSTRLAHRGPDGSGTSWFENDYIGIAHRRLAIIDLSPSASQPMQINDRYWLTFNGEIYNYIELRNELGTLGATFKTESDAEVLLQAYHFWGKNCLDKFNGMWAFAIYDTVNKTLFCARDRYGVKPFYFLDNAIHFAFASEIKALLCIRSQEVVANKKALQTYFASNQIETESEGFFKGIFELPQGHFLEYDYLSHCKKITKYESYAPICLKITRENLVDSLFNAIELRLRADVPIGFCLSGGIDSSSILSIASSINNEKKLATLNTGLHAFTAVHQSEEDESPWAQKMIEATQASWHTITLKSEELTEQIKNLIYYQDIPLLSTSTFAQSSVMRCASENGVKILIDGQGGDELFGGYQIFYPTFFKELFFRGRFRLFLKEWRHLKNSPTTKKYILKEWTMDLLSFLPNPLQALLLRKKRKSLKYVRKVPKIVRRRFNSLQSHLAFFCQEFELKNLLRWEDRCSMQYGIESRTPFADDSNLIQIARSLPITDLIQNGYSKFVLRESLKGQIPKEISWRRDKKGFSVPESQWLKQSKDFWKKTIRDKVHLDSSGLIDTEKLLNDLDTLFMEPTHSSQLNFIFKYACYLIWLDEFGICKFC